MKILVAYQSLTGNTKKVAGAIFEAIGDQKEMKELSQVMTRYSWASQLWGSGRRQKSRVS
jgi:flavodoxin